MEWCVISQPGLVSPLDHRYTRNYHIYALNLRCTQNTGAAGAALIGNLAQQCSNIIIMFLFCFFSTLLISGYLGTDVTFLPDIFIYCVQCPFLRWMLKRKHSTNAECRCGHSGRTAFSSRLGSDSLVSGQTAWRHSWIRILPNCRYSGQSDYLNEAVSDRRPGLGLSGCGQQWLWLAVAVASSGCG